MALDKNAGQRRAVSAMRNFLPVEATTEAVVAESLAPKPEAKVSEVPSYARKVEVTAPKTIEVAPAGAVTNPRHRKVSFFCSKELEERFKKARLKGGFDKLEDAYNRALEHFIKAVEKGEIDEF